MNRLTHKGWFGLCPVYLGDIESEGPVMVPRRLVPQLWLDFNDAAFGLAVWLITRVQPDFEPMFPILTTGELPEPIE